jgi:hypothetical protein
LTADSSVSVLNVEEETVIVLKKKGSHKTPQYNQVRVIVGVSASTVGYAKRRP